MRRKPRDRTSAFTVIELLVVIGIVGVLVSILLPAVQAAREAGRKAQCLMNLKNLGVALANYSEAACCFPPGRTPAYDPRYSGANYPCRALWIDKSLFAHLLPYLEQATLYSATNHELAILSRENATVIRTPLAVLCCPSDGAGAWVTTMSPGALGPTFPDPSDGPARLAGTSYAGGFGRLVLNGMPAYVSGCSPPSALVGQIDGVFNDVAPIRSRDVIDGLSSTVFIAEVSWRRRQAAGATCGGCIPATSGYWNLGDLDDALFVGLLGPNGDLRLTSTFPLAKSVRSTSAGSDHPGGLHALFGDGSAHFIADSIDSWPIDGASLGPRGATQEPDQSWSGLPPNGVWQRMITRAGNDPYSL